MFESIEWQLFLRVNDQRAATRVIGRTAALLDVPLELTSYDRSCENPELAVVELVSPLGVASLAEALLSTLRQANRVAYHVTLSGSELERSPYWFAFSGASTNSNGAGIRVAGIELLMVSTLESV